jgi:hypothetical protein
MKVTTFGIKVWRWFSVLLIVGGLAWTYSLLPDLVAVDFAASGMADHYIEKETIFYVLMGLILFNNVVIMAMARQVSKVPASLLPIPRRKLWAQHRSELDEHLINWLYCVVAAINTIMALSLFALATVNSSQYTQDVFDFAWLFYLGFGMLILIFVALPIRLLWTPVPDITLD